MASENILKEKERMITFKQIKKLSNHCDIMSTK